MIRVAKTEHYPGEPSAANMIRELQMALYGHSFAVPRSPAAEWERLLGVVRVRVERAAR
jgi:hypothetical protein